jgi:hypothetical protein
MKIEIPPQDLAILEAGLIELAKNAARLHAEIGRQVQEDALAQAVKPEAQG